MRGAGRALKAKTRPYRDQPADPWKVPRLRCREDPLPQPPYVRLRRAASQPGASAGRRPLVRSPRRCVVASNLSFGSGVFGHLLFTGSPDRVSTLSSPGHQARIRPVIRDRPAGGAGILVPVSRRVSAAGIRFSAILIPAKGLGPPHGRLTGQQRPDPDGVTAFRTHEQRPGWAPSIPRGRRCSSRTERLPGRRLPLPSGQSLNPAATSHRAGLRLTRHQRGFKQFTRPVFPSPAAARMERAAAWAFPRASHPADQEPNDARRGGDRPSSTDLELHAQLTSVDLQSGSSLNACDLASHGRAWAPPRTGRSAAGPTARAILLIRPYWGSRRKCWASGGILRLPGGRRSVFTSTGCSKRGGSTAATAAAD